MRFNFLSSIYLGLIATVSPFTNADSLQIEFQRKQRPFMRNLQRRNGGSVTASAYNAEGDLLYLVNITVGNPSQAISLQLDTGSSDTWLPFVGSQTCGDAKNPRCIGGSFDPSVSKSYKVLTPNGFSITYVDGTKILGDYISEDLTIGGASIPGLTMGLANTANEVDSSNDFTGILGIGFEMGEAVFATTNTTYPNLLSMMKNNGNINARAFSLWLNDRDNGVGSITFGAVDSAKYKGDLVSLPIQPDSRSNTILSFTVALDGISVIDASQSVAYQQNNLSLAVVLDSGTTITYLPDNIAQDLQVGVGAVSYSNYGLVVPCSLMQSTATINFRFGSSKGPIIAAPIGQFVLNFPPGFPAPTFKSSGEEACRWGIAASSGRPNIFGDTFLRGAYVVYNLDNNEIAIANAVLNATSSNIQTFSGTDIPGVSSTASGEAVSYTATARMAPNTITLTAPTSGVPITAVASGSTFNLGAPAATATNSASANHQGASTHIPIPRYFDIAVVFGMTTFALFSGSIFGFIA